MIEELLKNARRTPAGRLSLTSTEKAAIVEDWESSGLSCPLYCRRHGLIAAQLYKWRSDAKSGAVMGIKNEGNIHSKAELESLRKENEQLKAALGEAALDIRILKKKLAWDERRKKK